MPEAYSQTRNPALTSIRRPSCPKCQTRMSLARISPGPKGFDIRTFECGKCDHVHIVTVETDPMTSAIAGWLYSVGLRAPY